MLAATPLAGAGPVALTGPIVRLATEFAAGNLATSGAFPASSAPRSPRGTLRVMLMTRLMTATLASVRDRDGDHSATAVAQQGRARPGDDEARRELIDLERSWGEALVRADASEADRILAYEMVGTDPSGGTWNKSQYLERVKSAPSASNPSS